MIASPSACRRMMEPPRRNLCRGVPSGQSSTMPIHRVVITTPSGLLLGPPASGSQFEDGQSFAWWVMRPAVRLDPVHAGILDAQLFLALHQHGFEVVDPRSPSNPVLLRAKSDHR